MSILTPCIIKEKVNLKPKSVKIRKNSLDITVILLYIQL